MGDRCSEDKEMMTKLSWVIGNITHRGRDDWHRRWIEESLTVAEADQSTDTSASLVKLWLLDITYNELGYTVITNNLIGASSNSTLLYYAQQCVADCTIHTAVTTAIA